jgi:hypothetical protein
MPRSRVRFTIGSMIGWIAALGIFSWLITVPKRVGTRPENAGFTRGEPEPVASSADICDREPSRGHDDEPLPSGVETHARRASLRSAVPEALPFPPLPTRYSPGPAPKSDQGAEAYQRDLVPMPPVPSKVPPGILPNQTISNSRAIDEVGSPSVNEVATPNR